MFKPSRYCGAVLVSTPFTGCDVDDSFHIHVFCVQFCLFGFVVGLLVSCLVLVQCDTSGGKKTHCIWMFLFLFCDCKAYALTGCRCCYYRISLVTLCLPTPDGIYTLRWFVCSLTSPCPHPSHPILLSPEQFILTFHFVVLFSLILYFMNFLAYFVVRKSVNPARQTDPSCRFYHEHFK